ncbi:unnamed protein product [Linum trigynum]|uniref:DUF4283 domain-containing protein n=1 Tax=Linum trigynum TaxID=586398 RepID=A0AAV2CMN9_9ROSI
MVWARLPGLPIEFINREADERIASKIGRPIKVDRATQNGEMGRFARVCVEVDLMKPLLSQYKIEGRTYFIEFEGLYRIFTECGQYGHTSQGCPTLFKPTPEAQSNTDAAEGASTSQPTKPYGEWMVAKSRSHKQTNKGRRDKNVENSQATKEPTTSPTNGETGSRFDVLMTEEESNPMVNT